MTADLEMFLRQIGRFKHKHVYDRYDIAHDALVCRCGEMLPSLEIMFWKPR